ncbi:hypothetical protein [Ekhidna sp. To15]|uniref:hypothetical protein n=1 Tax=Ekhidna sp. To15 TaxID=3395267 RepID=UPI003F51BBED
MKISRWTDHILNFLAVILGVSLAFIISNRSEQAKVNNAFRENLTAILDEVEDDIYTFDSYQIPDNKRKLEEMQETLQMITEKVGEDSLGSKLNVFFDVNNYSPTNITINSLISSGKLDLISDFELKKKILAYQNTSKELVAQGEFHVEFLMDQVTPWFIRNSEYFVGNKSGWYKKENSEAVVIFSLYIAFVSNKIRKYESALEEAKVLRDLINEYQLEEGLE